MPEPIIEISRETLERALDAAADVAEELPADAETANDHRNPRRPRRGEREEEAVGFIVEPDPLRDTLSRLILHESARADILAGLRAMRLSDELERVWGISAIQPQSGRCIFNFYGDPGTGKTKAAKAIANELGKRIYQVDYSAIISKYLGDTAKHIVAAFKAAREADAILFFDEGDALMSKRVDSNESCSTSINQNRNVLMQEIDRFNSVVIVTTNLFKNYDPAILRRIQRHIKFELPNRSMREKIFELHLPKRQHVRASLLNAALESRGLSGGDILNVCINSMHAASLGDDSSAWVITDETIAKEIKKVRKAKREHGENGKRSRGPIGFNQTETSQLD